MSREDRGVTVRGAVRVRGGVPSSLADFVAVEEPLEIRVLGEPLATTMRTPGEDPRLALGFLFAEGIVRTVEELSSIAHCGRLGEEGYGNAIDVIPAGGVQLPIERVRAARRGTLTTSACGVCGRASIDDLLKLCEPIPADRTVPYPLLVGATAQLRDGQRNFDRTGGVHGAAAIDGTGQILAAFEDVGRHNAVDKVVGALVQQGKVASRAFPSATPALPPSQERPLILAVSGRASFEILQKATVAGIPVVASVSAASSLAIDLAERAGVTLATFVRGDGLNVYTHRRRIVGLPVGAE